MTNKNRPIMEIICKACGYKMDVEAIPLIDKAGHRSDFLIAAADVVSSALSSGGITEKQLDAFVHTVKDRVFDQQGKAMELYNTDIYFSRTVDVVTSHIAAGLVDIKDLGALFRTIEFKVNFERCNSDS